MKVIEASEKNQVVQVLEKLSFVPYNVLGVIKNTDDQIRFDSNSSTAWVSHEYFNYVYGSPDKVMQQFNALEAGFYGFPAVHGDLAPLLRKGSFLHWYEPTERHVFQGELEDLLERLRDCPYELINIPLCEAEGIDNRYEYKDDTTFTSIQDAIKNRPTSGVYLDGKLVSYALVHEDDSIGFMYTLEEYRHLGIGYWVTLDITAKMLQRGRVPFVEITEKNFKSQGLAKKTGYVKDAFTPWFGIIKGIPEWFETYSPYGDKGYIFTSLAHLRVVNLLSEGSESFTLTGNETCFTGFLDSIEGPVFSLKPDETGEAYALELTDGLSVSILEVVKGIAAHLPMKNASLVLPYEASLIGEIGGYWVDVQHTVVFSE